MKNIFIRIAVCILIVFISKNSIAVPAIGAASAEAVVSEIEKTFSEVKLLVEKSLAGKTEKESLGPLNSAKEILEKSAAKAGELYEEFSAKRKSLSEKSPLYQQHLDLEADLYSLKRDLSEVSRDIEHALHAESAKDVEYHLKKTEKSFLEIEKMLKAITLQLQTFKQN